MLHLGPLAMERAVGVPPPYSPFCASEVRKHGQESADQMNTVKEANLQDGGGHVHLGQSSIAPAV